MYARLTEDGALVMNLLLRRPVSKTSTPRPGRDAAWRPRTAGRFAMGTTRGGASTQTNGDAVAETANPPINVQCVSWLATGPTNPTCALSKADAQPTPDREEEEDSNGDRYAMIHLLVVAAVAAAIPGA